MALEPRNSGTGSDPHGPAGSPPPARPPGDVVLIVSGEVDLATRDELLIRLLTVVLTSRRRVVIDLTDVDFLDAAGARALRRGHKLARDLGVDVALRGPQPGVRRVLDLTGTDVLMTVE